MANLNEVLQEFQTSWRRISTTWFEATQLWTDEVSRRFEKDFLKVLEHESGKTYSTMTDLAKVIAEARQRVR